VSNQSAFYSTGLRTPKERPRGENVVDLMDALRKSVGGATAETKTPKKPATKAKKAAAGQKEMLTDNRQEAAKETAKKPAAVARRRSA
jgi:DNA end-binding protein Ku